MQLCIEAVDQAGGCSYGYSCVYTDTISWAAPNQPLPMIRDPRFAFDQLFGVGATPEERRAAPAGGSQHPRCDHRCGGTAAQHARRRGSRAARRAISTKCARSSGAFSASRRATPAASERELPGAPAGVPDSFSEHVKLMFDLQALAFAGDTTRVFSFKLGRDASSRAYPESGTQDRRSTRRRITASARSASSTSRRSTRTTSAWCRTSSQKLRNTPDGDGNLLDNTLVIYGSPMGNSNVHNHKRCPLFLAGHAGGQLKGGLHLKAPDGTPMANVFLTLLHNLGVELEKFGDSTGRVRSEPCGTRVYADTARCQGAG